MGKKVFVIKIFGTNLRKQSLINKSQIKNQILHKNRIILKYLLQKENLNYKFIFFSFRNWGFHWNEGGSSNDPCDEAYMGNISYNNNKNIDNYLKNEISMNTV